MNLKDANILIVEDNDINQKIMSLSLKNSVLNIDFAYNGKEALEKLENNFYNIIFMDDTMPEMDGYICTSIIRENEKKSETHIPIIGFTARPEDSEMFKASGLDCLIIRPFQLPDLLEKMNYYVNRIY